MSFRTGGVRGADAREGGAGRVRNEIQIIACSHFMLTSHSFSGHLMTRGGDLTSVVINYLIILIKK